MTYYFTIGLNDQNTKTQLIKTDVAEMIIADYIAANFLGGTLFPCKGIYKHENGTTVKENTFMLMLANITKEEAIETAEHFKTVFNQESIGVLPINAEMAFI